MYLLEHQMRVNTQLKIVPHNCARVSMFAKHWSAQLTRLGMGLSVTDSVGKYWQTGEGFFMRFVTIWKNIE